MDLPALLPKELTYTQVASDDQMLKKMLEKIPYDFVHFFVSAAEDETWSEAHKAFMQKALFWFQEKAFQDKLLYEFIKEIVGAISRHPHFLIPLLEKNISFVVQGSVFASSSLLWQGASEYLHRLIRRECRDRRENVINLTDISIEAFQDVEEFVFFGESKTLWRKVPKEIFETLELSIKWEILPLQQICQELLKRYIDRTNVIQWLKISIQKSLPHLLQACLDFINQVTPTIKLQSRSHGLLSLEFLTFDQSALDLFSELKQEITELEFSERLWQESEFSQLVLQVPKLQGVSLTGSLSFSDRYLDLPQHLAHLNLSKCAWLNKETFAKLIAVCPKVTSLNLASNRELNYLAWGELKKLTHLQELDLSHCYQINDADFKVIVQSSKKLKKLIINEVSLVADPTFLWFSRQLAALEYLDLSRTNISDEALIEIATHNPNLQTVVLKRCRSITHRGIYEMKKQLNQVEIIQ